MVSFRNGSFGGPDADPEWDGPSILDDLGRLAEVEELVQTSRDALFWKVMRMPAAFWRQDEIWKDQEGVIHRLTEMHPEHLRNVMNFLLRRAGAYKAYEEETSIAFEVLGAPHGDMAQDMIDQEMDRLFETPAWRWMFNTPLFQAMRRAYHDMPKPPRVRWSKHGRMPDRIDLSKF